MSLLNWMYLKPPQQSSQQYDIAAQAQQAIRSTGNGLSDQAMGLTFVENIAGQWTLYIVRETSYQPNSAIIFAKCTYTLDVGLDKTLARIPMNVQPGLATFDVVRGIAIPLAGGEMNARVTVSYPNPVLAQVPDKDILKAWVAPGRATEHWIPNETSGVTNVANLPTSTTLLEVPTFARRVRLRWFAQAGTAAPNAVLARFYNNLGNSVPRGMQEDVPLLFEQDVEVSVPQWASRIGFYTPVVGDAQPLINVDWGCWS